MQYMGSAHMHSAAQCSAHMQSAVRAHAEHSAMQGAMQAGRAQRNAGRNTEHTHLMNLCSAFSLETGSQSPCPQCTGLSVGRDRGEALGAFPGKLPTSVVFKEGFKDLERGVQGVP